MFYLQTANPQSGTGFWVMEKVVVVHLNHAKLSWIKPFKKQIKAKNDKRNREVQDRKQLQIGLEIELVLHSGFSSSKIILKQDKCPKQQRAVCYKMRIHPIFFHNLNIHSQIYFTLITLQMLISL